MLKGSLSLSALAGAAMLAITGAAFAQSGVYQPTPGENEPAGAAPYALVFHPNGAMESVPVDKKTMTEAMTHAKPLTAPLIVVVSNGKAYMVEDTKMANGQMMSEMLATYRLNDRNR
jgi:methionine-rich copper-binding protein CopC